MIEWYEDKARGVTCIEADGAAVAELSSGTQAHAVFMWLSSLDPAVQRGVIAALTGKPLTDEIVAAI